MRRLPYLFFIFGMLCWGCTGGGDGSAAGSADMQAGDMQPGDMQAGDMQASDMQPPDMGPPALPPFVLRMQADARIGGVGQTFRIEALPGGEPPADLRFEWSAPDGMGVAEGPVYSVRYDTPGLYTIEVTATADGQSVTNGVVVQVYPPAPVVGDVDGNGARDAADLALLRDSLAGRAPFDEATAGRADVDRDGAVDARDVEALAQLLAGEDLRWVRPAAGSRGTVVQIAHPAFLDPTARFTARFDDAELPLDRGTPGFATIVVPLEAEQASAAEISLWQGEDAVDRFAFDVLDPPAVQGDEVPRAFEQIQAAIEVLPPLIDTYLADLQIPDDERALMTAMLQTVSTELRAERAHFATYWDQLSPEQQAIYTEIALANGLGEALSELDRIGAGLRAGMGQISTERLIELICMARDLSGVAAQVVRVNNIASYVIDALWFLSFFVPPLAPVVAGLGTINELLGAVMDAFQLILGFVPQLGNTLSLTAMPADLDRDADTTVTAAITVHIAGGLCAGGAAAATGALFNALKDRLMARLFGRIPGFGKVYRRARNQRTMVARLINGIARALGQIIDVVLEATGIQARVAAMAAAVCEAIAPGQPWELASGGLTWDADCGAVVNGVWTCTPECGDKQVRITAERDVCGKTVHGSVVVNCAGCRATCPDGCCTADGECVGTAEQDAAQCGSEGRRCGACADEQVCDGGACTCVGTCAEDEVGTGRCADANTAETCEAASDGCFRWTPTDCAASGATCEDGACTGGCGPWNCQGCCTGDHACTGFDDQNVAACGRGGAACGGCAENDECIGGNCVCRGPACDPPFRAGSRGDPHLITLDGLAYDFQGAGEFVLARSGDGPNRLEVQARQVPVRDPVCSQTVTVNRAFAFAVGDVRVTFDNTRAHPFWVDGLAVDPPFDMEWPVGEGTLYRDNRVDAILRWPDGSAVRIRAWGSAHLGIQLAAGRPSEGLLGDVDGDPANDLRLADGTVVERPVPFAVLYGAFADAWRVTAETSLFDYDPGRGPADWAIADYPRQLASPDHIPEETRVSAEALCDGLGIEDPVLRTACVVDIACTGDPGAVASLLDLEPPVDSVEVTDPPVDPVDPADLDACRVQGRNVPGERVTVTHFCPARCIDVACGVWGTDVYTDDSCVCRAALHAGLLAPGEAGEVELQPIEGQPSYEGSERNGVSTRNYGSWPGAFQFPAVIPACRHTGRDYLWFSPADPCEDDRLPHDHYCHNCPADCDPYQVWGTDTYHGNSSLCSAAVHAGVINAAAGGRIFFYFPLNEADDYVGSARNGIESLDREHWPLSFEFLAEYE